MSARTEGASGTVVIRRAVPAEHARLSALAFASKAHWGYSDAFMEACRAELSYAADELERDAFHVLLVDDDLVGFHALSRLSARRVELEALFVRPDMIGRGYGRMLIEHAVASARATGAAELLIQGDPHAADFYRCAGGVLVGERESGSIAGRTLPVFSIALGDARDRGDG